MAIRRWNGGSGFWSPSSNWVDFNSQPAAVPTAGDDVTIDSGTVNNNAVAVASTLSLGNAGTLFNLANLTVDGFIRIGTGGVGTAALLIAGGTVSATSMIVGFNNTGLLLVSGGSTLNSAGLIDVGIGATVGLIFVGGSGAPGSAGTINGNIALNNAASSLNFRTIDAAAYGGNISGTGAININSAGQTITFTGDNRGHSGTTSIQAGTLQIGNGGLSGYLGTGAVINNGNLAFVFDVNSQVDREVSGAISGTGNLNVSGGVQLTLAADNSYSGTTTIANNSRLRVGNGGTTGTLGTGDVVHNGFELSFNHSAGTYVHNNAISGSGRLFFNGLGTEILTGNNSYSGGTVVSSGTTLVVGNGGTTGSLGSGGVSLDEGAQLHLNRSDTQIIAIDIAGRAPGDGTVRVVGNHIAILTGDNIYGATIIDSGSTLQIGNGGSTGTLGLGAVTNNGTLSFNHSFGNYFHGNVIGGTGGITVNGSGAEILSAVNTYTGATIVNNTTLALSGAGSIANSALVTLNGTGRFNIGNISGALTSVRDVYLTAVGTEIALFGKTLIVTEANSFAGPGAITGSGGADSVIFNVATANFTLAGIQGAVFNSWTDGVDSIVINGGAIANMLTGDELRATNINGGAGNDRIIIGNGAGNYDGGVDSDTLVVGSSMTLTGTLAGFEALELSAGANLTLSSTQFTTGLASNTAVSGTGTLTINMDTPGFFISKLFTFAGTGVSVVVNGTTGTDIFKLGNAAHTINAGDGTDQIKGGDQSDTINGGSGIDKINAAGGADILTGGLGNDVFQFAKATDSGLGTAADRITDYAIGGDRLNFSRIDTNAGLAGDQGFAFVGSAAFSGGGVASIRYANSGADLLVQADVDGNGTADMEIILQGLAGGTLTAADFVL